VLLHFSKDLLRDLGRERRQPKSSEWAFHDEAIAAVFEIEFHVVG
jgi:hypothetical protein